MDKHCLPIILVIILFFCSAFSEDNYNHNFTNEYQSSAGAVAFDHEAHSTKRQKDCHECHSALKIFGGSMTELLAHNYCKNCHASNNGPTECYGCHDQNKIANK